jgi:DNA-binding LacI/PurR family transcriptional regulator
LIVGICAVLGFDLDRSLGVSGTAFALCTFILTQYQAQGPRTRRVVMIPKSRSPFSSSIHRGLSDLIAASTTIAFSVEWPENIRTSELDWQINVLRSQSCVIADAIVIVPAGDDERLWTELVRATREGKFIVVVDTKPKNAFFGQRNARSPFFVGSNFTAGGDCVGAELATLLAAKPDRRAIFAWGPSSSWPGMERTRGTSTALLLAGVSNRVVPVELADWQRDANADHIVNHIRRALEESGGEIVVYCGNDKIMEAVERRLMRGLEIRDRNRVGLIGYDGIATSEGGLLVHSSCMSIATVDTRPEEQGRVAAQVLMEEHNGLMDGRGSRYIEPILIRSKLGVEWSSAGT